MLAEPLIPRLMTVEEFLAWTPGPGETWELVDGVPRAMAPAGITHGALQGELARVLGNHLAARGLPCRVVIAPGVTPRAERGHNVRIPELAVSCAPSVPGAKLLAEPQVIIEIPSPTNPADTRSNVWTYLTIPSVREILVVRSERIGAELLIREADGGWPEDPERIVTGAIRLPSLDFEVPLTELHRTTGLAAS